MGFVAKLTDAILIFFFLVMAVAVPLLDAQLLLPPTCFPRFLVHLYNWYCTLFGHYLMADKPHFFVGVVWFELIFQWPLALLNLHAIWAAKPWFNTTCVIYGVSQFSSMVGTLSEMVGSKRAPLRLLVLCFPFMGFGVLATLRGLLSHSTATFSNVGKGSAMPRIKRA